VVAIELPDGRQANGCSKPGVGSIADCRLAFLLYTRIVLRYLGIDGLEVSVPLCYRGRTNSSFVWHGPCGSSMLRTKKAASPLQLSSSFDGSDPEIGHFRVCEDPHHEHTLDQHSDIGNDLSTPLECVP
jgi:hypothetical protein